MEKYLKIFVMLMAGASFLIPSAPSLHAVELEQKGIRAEGLKALVGQLKQQAQKWARDELDEKAVHAMAKKIKSVTYDMKSVELLAKQLAVGGKSVKDLYVANRLVRPLLLAKTDVIRKALPAVKRAHRRLARYCMSRKIPNKPKQSKEADKTLATSRPATQPAKKGDFCKLAIKRNKEVRLFNKTLYELMLFANDIKQDRELIKKLQKYERKVCWNYVDIIETVLSNVRTMDARQAEVFYNAFVEYGRKLGLKKAKYNRWFELTVKEGRKIEPIKQVDSPGIRLLKAANLLAPIAKKPAVVVPGEKDKKPAKKPGHRKSRRKR